MANDQPDTELDGQGDACDADDDDDTVADGQDNCPAHTNDTQRDSDNDGKGDACDTAFDSGDGMIAGGGSITGADGSKIHFAYSASSENDRVAGIGELRHGTMRVRLLDADGYAQSDDRSVIVGNAVRGGQTVDYRPETIDAGEPGRDRDTFELEAGNERWAGTLAGGNLTVER